MKPFIERLIIKNYKSIAYCDVRLGALQFLVGRNGSGKSNFLDALAFIRDSLENNRIDKACDMRGTIVLMPHHNYAGSSMPLSMRLEFNLANGTNGIFAFELGQDDNASLKIIRELCVIKRDNKEIAKYETRDGKTQYEDPKRFPPVFPDRFYLQSMNGFDEYRPIYDALHNLQIHNFNPKSILAIDSIKNSPVFKANGSNVAQVLFDLSPKTQERINEYLGNIVPSFDRFEIQEVEKQLCLNFYIKSTEEYFMPDSMSDGTLRALCMLTALLQEQKSGKNKTPVLIGIEEPETGLHARAAGALLSVLEEGADMRQVIIATHSVEMLDHKDIKPAQILPVELKDFTTLIAPLEKNAKEMLQDHLLTAGDLLRQDKLKPAKMFDGEKEISLFDNEFGGIEK